MDFDADVKDLIKQLTQHDLSKRLGNLRFGSEDIKNHRFFSGSSSGGGGTNNTCYDRSSKPYFQAINS